MSLATSHRTHTCGELRTAHIGQTVALCGWLHNRRDHGGVLFIDLRDHYGITQVVIHPDVDFLDAVGHLPKETVLRFQGAVIARTPENVNPKMVTGEIEVKAAGYEVLGPCQGLPLSICPEEEAPEDTRLRYRFLDLRKQQLHQNIVLRSRVIAGIRRRMTALGFNEFQTPILTSSSPEGARDYLVPSRIHPGMFYALPQAPQQFKQLLMVAGFDRYFQIAPCFRDEDARADRSPGEFYQLDIEMSFVSQDDVFAVVEEVIGGVFTEFGDWKSDTVPFRRIPYREAMLKYGTDKPDLRIPIEACDVSALFAAADFKAFREVVTQSGVVRAIPVKGIAAQSRSFFDRLVEFAIASGSKGLAYLVWGEDKVKGPIVKFLTPEQQQALAAQCGAATGDVVFFIAGVEAEANRLVGLVRSKIGADLDLAEKNVFRFCWIVDFPMYEWDAERKCIAFSHNPFSMPQGGLEALDTRDPLTILANQYDIVCNGVELSSGAIRNHDPQVMYKAFEIAGYSREQVDAKFGGMINAFKHGAPPHGGIAPGIDRMVMLLAHADNIREVIAFPMNQKAQDLMMNAPSEVTDKQLQELHIRVVKPLHEKP
jgi:aspartyl-tRNA synthetase